MASVSHFQSLIWFSGQPGGEGPAGEAQRDEDRPAAAAPPRIQIVEDEAILAWSLEASLQDLGYVICGIAPTGAEAIRMALATKPDLILMDIRLADDITGIVAAERILASHRVPIIFITAYSDREVADKAARLGAELLPKPVEAHHLDVVMRRLLARKNEQ